MSQEQLETLTGTVRTITFQNPENGYTVARIVRKDDGKLVTVTGTVKMLSAGETVVFRGYWVDDAKYGRQFRFHSYESVVPASVEGIRGFLESKHFDGIGPVLAGRIVEMFGTDTVRILDEEPDRLRKVKGITKKKLVAVKAGWQEHRAIRDVMIFLQSHDISPAYAARIYEVYRHDTIDKLRSNPYRLIDDIRGIGFIKADQVATRLGIAADAPDRIRAGLRHALDNAVDAGNVYLPAERLVETAAAILGSDADLVLSVMNRMAERRELTAEEDRIYLPDLAQCEIEIADRLHTLAGTSLRPEAPDSAAADALIAALEREDSLALAPLQREAVMTAVTSPALVLTGGPGTGKTTTIHGMIDVFRRLRLSVMLCAPTGRAAKRLTEATGVEARTIHRLLEFNPHTGRFSKNEGDYLGTHVVIMDEASMVDTMLLTDVLRAIAPGTRLIMVGDVDQLPSIGPGNVLRDIIDSGTVPVVRLTEIFRQAAASRIVGSAHRINEGQLPYIDNDHGGNFFFIRCREPERITETILDMVVRRLPKRYGFDPVGDIQVLASMHRSETGVANLNARLQERLNPHDPRRAEVQRGSWTFRAGDKVMQVRNNYDKLVFNGDIGRVTEVDPRNKCLTVRFDDPVSYAFTELDDLAPAYAISVHKSQGSEFRCVVIPVSTQHFIMLKRNLLYTAVTRARELVVLVGDMKALAIAVKNDQVRERFTSLQERLAGVFRRG